MAARCGTNRLPRVPTARDFDAVNKFPARGGSIEGPGAVVAGGRVFIASGYTRNGGMPGNVLLAFGVE